jgi:hypothetical protein
MGLLDYHARWYDPGLARFISADSIVPNPGSSMSWDKFVYVNGNPLSFIDPTGHFGKHREDRSDYWNKRNQEKVKELEKKWDDEKETARLRELVRQANKEMSLDGSLGFSLLYGGKSLLRQLFDPPQPGSLIRNIIEFQVGLMAISAGFGVFAIGATITSTALLVAVGTVAVASPIGLLVDGPHAGLAAIFGVATMVVGAGLVFAGSTLLLDSIQTLPTGAKLDQIYEPTGAHWAGRME